MDETEREIDRTQTDRR